MLGDRAFDLLVLLARRPGEPVAALALQRALWQGRRVDPANLRMQVSALRRQLGPGAVQTVAGRGYLLALPVAPFMRSEAPASPGLMSGPLPLPPDPLIGREACLLQLDTLLQQHRLVCLLGPGGGAGHAGAAGLR